MHARLQIRGYLCESCKRKVRKEMFASGGGGGGEALQCPQERMRVRWRLIPVVVCVEPLSLLGNAAMLVCGSPRPMASNVCHLSG